MPTRYTPILRISKNGVKKSPMLPARNSMLSGYIALNDAMSICIECGWTIDYSSVDVSDGPEYVLEAKEVNELTDAEFN